MKTNVALNLDDQDRNSLANFIDGKKSARLATRAEIVQLSRQLVKALVKAQVQVAQSVVSGETSIGLVIKDINEGGWSMLDWD